jgi:hypothetical protein
VTGRSRGKLRSMLAASVSNLLWTLLTLAIMMGLAILARRIDPHWASKDGRAFTCKLQPIDRNGRVEGRWREGRGVVEGDVVKIVVRGLGVHKTQPYAAHHVSGRSQTPPPKSAVFLLDGEPMWALRIPERSRAVPVLDELSRQR